MDEFTLAKKLQNLQTIKPNTEWVAFNKSEILAKEFDQQNSFSLSNISAVFASALQAPQLIKVYASVAVVIFSAFGFVVASRNAMPGDALYAIRQAEEKVRLAVIMSPEQKTVAQVEQVSTRLDELDIVSKTGNNEEKKLAVISEAKKAVVEATKEIAKLSGEQQASLIGKLASKIQTVEKNSNAAIMDKDEPSFDSIYKFLAASEIKEFENNTKNLTIKQRDLLKKAKDFFAVNKYSEAYEMLMLIQPAPSDSSDSK